jgi:hypothetical protein
MVVVVMLTPALAIPMSMCRKISNGTVRTWASGRVVKVHPRMTRK